MGIIQALPEIRPELDQFGQSLFMADNERPLWVNAGYVSVLGHYDITNYFVFTPEDEVS